MAVIFASTGFTASAAQLLQNLPHTTTGHPDTGGQGGAAAILVFWSRFTTRTSRRACAASDRTVGPGSLHNPRNGSLRNPASRIIFGPALAQARHPPGAACLKSTGLQFAHPERSSRRRHDITSAQIHGTASRRSEVAPAPPPQDH